MRQIPTVVIMDDEETDRERLAHALEDLGCVTKDARNTAEAMLYVKAGERAFVLDIRMKGERFSNAGLVMVGRIHNLCPRAFIGVYSEHLGDNEQVAYELGAAIVVRKGVPEMDALLLLNSLLKHDSSGGGGFHRLIGWVKGIVLDIPSHWLYDFLKSYFTNTR
jgi:CheY-like chemotaxis protein